MSRTVKALTFTLAGILTLLIAVPWLVPLASFIPSVESRATAALGQPVRVADLRLSLLPLQITATQVTSPAIQVDRIRARLSPLHLLSGTLVLEEVELDRVRVRPEFFRRVATRRASAATPGARVRRIVLKDVEIQFERTTLRSLQGVVTLASNGRVQEIRVQHQGDRLKIVAKPAAGGFELAIAARKWTLPAGPPIAFDRIEALARLTVEGISTPALSASLYGGTLAGPLTVNWRPDWSIAGELMVDGVQVQPLARLLSSEAAVSGRLQATPRFALRARKPAALIASLRLESAFRVEDGTLQRVDLEAAARNPLSGDAVRQGSTRFEHLTGHLEVDGDGYHFSGLKVESGMLAGHREKYPCPTINAWKGASTRSSRRPAPISPAAAREPARCRNPACGPARPQLLAALAGSVLLPGIGTAVGLKAGQLTEQLFGRSAVRRPSWPSLLRAPRPRRRDASWRPSTRRDGVGDVIDVVRSSAPPRRSDRCRRHRSRIPHAGAATAACDSPE